MRPKTHSFSGVGNRPSTWVPHYRRPPPIMVNEISLYSRQQAEQQLRRQRHRAKPLQITHISSTIRNLTHKGPAKSVDAYILTKPPSSLGSSAEDSEPPAQPTPTPKAEDTVIEMMGNGYGGYGARKKRVVATPASSGFSFFREILFRIAEFICSLRGNAYC